MEENILNELVKTCDKFILFLFSHSFRCSLCMYNNNKRGQEKICQQEKICHLPYSTISEPALALHCLLFYSSSKRSNKVSDALPQDESTDISVEFRLTYLKVMHAILIGKIETVQLKSADKLKS
ncbi:hypothetical protein LOAG_10309 [Loa loa]|uniref:Uncharacterized protein n=1 Tax=Loa loa TaxID=7209 RepID=A0A1S0TRP0_LOALO|nr:hypothetical protein LOAG_10309 [Loa loa]EFO18187.1 hypothetical protein LOAG_10309 [Loa loa]